MKAGKLLVPIAFSLLILNACTESKNPYMSIEGLTQGTSYHITYQCPKDSIDLTEAVNDLLHEFDMSLSTYIETSLISQINNNETDKADVYLTKVFEEALRIYKLTDGAFDITVGPLVNAWGFGPGRKLNMSQNTIDSLMNFVGMDMIRLENGRIIKERPELRMDLNAIAQGYAVDIVADYFSVLGITNYMIEIGGEIRTLGLSSRGIAWRIGIDKPVFGNKIPGQELQQILSLSGKSLASSGNYRKYYEVDGKKIVHTIDPVSGYTRMSKLLSVTIITDECMTADALSTSCMVLGLDKAIEFVESLDGVEGYFIYTDEDGIFLEWSSEGMEEMLD